MDQAYDEEEVGTLLLGTPQEINLAIERFDGARREQVLRRLVAERLPVGAAALWDLYQDALVAVIREARRGHYRPTGSLEAYVMRIAINRAIDQHRRQRRATEKLGDLADRMRDALAGTRVGRSFVDADEEGQWRLLDRIWAEIARLPDRQHQATMVWWEHVVADEPIAWDTIAAEIGDRYGPTTVDAAKSAVGEARKKLRATIERWRKAEDRQ